MTKKTDYTLLNGLALAYVGDAIYEIYIRDFLIRQGLTKPNMLHKTATKYVSAKSQAYLMKLILEAEILSEAEVLMYKRGRNAKSHTYAKNADVTTYRISTGFESLFGYLHLTDQKSRVEELVMWCIDKIGEKENE